MLKILTSHACNASRTYGTEVRVRFAPSPTGFLHLGGLRTALYNFLFAKLNKGKFILRIEDTDQTRVVHGAAEQIQKDLNWAGIHIDEGPRIGGPCGPYLQSHRIHLYKEQLNVLLENKTAYHCFCTNKRLDLLRLEALRTRQIPKYDNRCRHLTDEEVDKKLKNKEPFCVRFKLTPGEQFFRDLIYGSITYDVALNEGDPVIFKSDGFPTYHFANVVDDHSMQISHVLRGVEWQISTTKHIMLYRAFNWDPPFYGHLPLLLNADGTKLSKRQNDIKISRYKESGVLPQALINFITHSGGGFDKDQQRFLKPKIYNMEELIHQFDVNKINSHSGKLMPERLSEFNQLELERQLLSEDDLPLLVARMQNIVKNKFPQRVSDDTLHLDFDYIKSTLNWASNRISRLEDLVSHQMAFLWVCPDFNRRLEEGQLTAIQKLSRSLEQEENFTKERLKVVLKDFCETNELKFANLMQLVRSILSGLKEGPSVAEMIEILGKENTLIRLQTYINKYET